MSFATLIGAFLMAVFLRAVKKYLKMDMNERQAYICLRRKNFKDVMKKEAAFWLTCQIKLRFIRKMRQVSGQTKLMESEVFYWETRSMQ